MEQLFAVPTESGVLCTHFGHCEKFALVKTEDGRIINKEFVQPPLHQPGVYPKFLSDLGVDVIIAGGMGYKAQEMFSQNNIKVFVGVESETPENLVQNYLNNQLIYGDNLCDH